MEDMASRDFKTTKVRFSISIKSKNKVTLAQQLLYLDVVPDLLTTYIMFSEVECNYVFVKVKGN